jgi:hypothetical protein
MADFLVIIKCKDELNNKFIFLCKNTLKLKVYDENIAKIYETL